MKKGCFIKFIVILTIVIAAITYIIQNKSDEWLFQPGKKLFKPELMKEIDSLLIGAGDSQYSDSVKLIIGEYFDNATLSDLSNNKVEAAMLLIKNSVKDSSISVDEYSKIRELLSYPENHERSEKNRN